MENQFVHILVDMPGNTANSFFVLMELSESSFTVAKNPGDTDV